MGLDNTWVKRGSKDWFELEDDCFDSGEDVIASYMCGSFSGKLYDTFVRRVTGTSLYAERIFNSTVCKMADALEKYQDDGNDEFTGEYADEYKDLVKMFRFYADAGAELISDW